MSPSPKVVSSEDRRFEIRYSPRLRWLFSILGMGPRWSGVVCEAERVGQAAALRVRMGYAFRATVPLSSIRQASHERDVWWAIGVHGDFRGSWLVNGSATGIVGLYLDPPPLGRTMGIPIRLRRLRLGLADPDGFLAALATMGASGRPASSVDPR